MQSDMDSSVINSIRNIVVDHEEFHRGREILEHCYQLKQHGFEGCLGIAILGESGVGKTTLIRKFSENHLGSSTETQTYSPIIVVTVPPKPSGNSLCSAILKGLSDPFAYNRDTEDKKRSRVIHLIRECGTTVIILDEMQHFTNRWNNKVAHDAADSLKSIMDETNVMMVIVGLEYGKSLFVQNEQLRRRFSYNITLPRFNWNNESSRKQFKGMLRVVQKSIVSFQIIDLSSPETSFRMYLASGGLASYVMTLLEQAALIAYVKNRFEIGVDELARAYDAIQVSYPKKANPFILTISPAQTEQLYQQYELIGLAEIDRTIAKRK